MVEVCALSETKVLLVYTVRSLPQNHMGHELEGNTAGICIYGSRHRHCCCLICIALIIRVRTVPVMLLLCFAGACLVKYGSLFTRLFMVPNPALALAMVLIPPLAYAGALLMAKKE